MKNTDEKIRLIIADDHAVLRKGLEYLFSLEKDFLLLSALANGKELISAVKEHKPDVVITDLKMAPISGTEACIQLQQELPETAIIVYSMYDSEDLVRQMRGLGVRGYVVKDGKDREICNAVRVVHSGGEYYCKTIRQRTAQHFRNGQLGHGTAEKKGEFTTQELQIIGLICKECSTKEISDQLKIKERTVQFHKEQIESKMGVRGVVGIAVYAVQNWLLY